jgi:hypothetical protein
MNQRQPISYADMGLMIAVQYIAGTEDFSLHCSSYMGSAPHQPSYLVSA